MDKLIEDLLKLSRVGRSELQHRDVNLSALAEGICGELIQSQPDRHVSFTIGAGLRARGDERLLRIVLENLLRNANPRLAVEVLLLDIPQVREILLSVVIHATN